MNSAATQSVPLSNVDLAWLRMEDPANLMMASGLLLFEEPLDFQRLQATIEHRLLALDRFRQRVEEPRLPWGRPRWKEDERFSLSSHLHRIALPGSGDEESLRNLVSVLMSTPLDYSKPLWQIHLIERYGDGCAVLARIHHCVADGIALMQVLLSLTDQHADAPCPDASGAVAGDHPPRDSPSVLSSAAATVSGALRLTRAAFDFGADAVRNPSRILEVAELGASGAAALQRLVLRPPDPKTLLKGELGVPKRAVWSQPISLAEVKAVGRATGGTVNDVLLSAVAGALRRYLIFRGERVDGRDFHAAVPVNLRSPQEGPELGNRFGLVFLCLPVGIADPLQRLVELKRRMDELKGSSEAVIALGLLGLLGQSPAAIQSLLVDFFGAKTTAVMSNVPGPRDRVYLAGRPVSSLMFWVPQSGRVGLGISVLSYAGEVRMGVASDCGLVPDPERIGEAFHLELDALIELARTGRGRAEAS